ncbi:hypothetical protein B0H11DRAFT_1912201 [Mycena galericulata]|nr:hypothetical protein B0H11DRAFT_1912201 [Mycena galericulata]
MVKDYFTQSPKISNALETTINLFSRIKGDTAEDTNWRETHVCPVCYSASPAASIVLSCGCRHTVYHLKCVLKWHFKAGVADLLKCPMCRAPTKPVNVYWVSPLSKAEIRAKAHRKHRKNAELRKSDPKRKAKEQRRKADSKLLAEKGLDVISLDSRKGPRQSRAAFGVVLEVLSYDSLTTWTQKYCCDVDPAVLGVGVGVVGGAEDGVSADAAVDVNAERADLKARLYLGTQGEEIDLAAVLAESLGTEAPKDKPNLEGASGSQAPGASFSTAVPASPCTAATGSVNLVTYIEAALAYELVQNESVAAFIVSGNSDFLQKMTRIKSRTNGLDLGQVVNGAGGGLRWRSSRTQPALRPKARLRGNVYDQLVERGLRIGRQRSETPTGNDGGDKGRVRSWIPEVLWKTGERPKSCAAQSMTTASGSVEAGLHDQYNKVNEGREQEEPPIESGGGGIGVEVAEDAFERSSGWEVGKEGWVLPMGEAGHDDTLVVGGDGVKVLAFLCRQPSRSVLHTARSRQRTPTAPYCDNVNNSSVPEDVLSHYHLVEELAHRASGGPTSESRFDARRDLTFGAACDEDLTLDRAGELLPSEPLPVLLALRNLDDLDSGARCGALAVHPVAIIQPAVASSQSAIFTLGGFGINSSGTDDPNPTRKLDDRNVDEKLMAGFGHEQMDLWVNLVS